MIHKDRLSRFKIGAHRCGHDIVLGHDICYACVIVFQETQIPVGKDTHQLALFVNNGHTADPVLSHELVCLCHGLVGSEGKGIYYNAVFRTLYFVYLISLLFDGHIFVDDAYAALSCYGNSHL